MPEGKIVKALSGYYYVLDGERLIQCRGRGVFRKRKITPLVGDQVAYQAENDLEGTVVEIMERKNELVRPPISNIDQAFLVFSAKEPDFNQGLLDRFLVMIEASNITPIICVTKMDLLSEEEHQKLEKYLTIYREIGYEVLLSSTKTEETMDYLLPHFKGYTSVFAGQSGVGKSSLLNKLKPELELQTNAISNHLGRGKHTTRHVELLEVTENGFVADTPGFSSLDFIDVEAEDLQLYFPEIQSLSHGCKFRGCMHVNEPKCAVKTAVETETIATFRYENYLQFLQEIKDRKPRY